MKSMQRLRLLLLLTAALMVICGVQMVLSLVYDAWTSFAIAAVVFVVLAFVVRFLLRCGVSIAWHIQNGSE